MWCLWLSVLVFAFHSKTLQYPEPIIGLCCDCDLHQRWRTRNVGSTKRVPYNRVLVVDVQRGGGGCTEMHRYLYKYINIITSNIICTVLVTNFSHSRQVVVCVLILNSRATAAASPNVLVSLSLVQLNMHSSVCLRR